MNDIKRKINGKKSKIFMDYSGLIFNYIDMQFIYRLIIIIDLKDIE